MSDILILRWWNFQMRQAISFTKQQKGVKCKKIDFDSIFRILILKKKKKKEGTMQPTKNFHKINIYRNLWICLEVDVLQCEKKVT